MWLLASFNEMNEGFELCFFRLSLAEVELRIGDSFKIVTVQAARSMEGRREGAGRC